MKSNYGDEHLVENIGYEPAFRYVVLAFALVPPTSINN